MATYDSLQYVSLGAPAASITLSSIPGTYTHLKLIISSITNSSGNATQIQFNADSASNYSHRYVRGNSSTASSSSVQNESSVIVSMGFTSSTIPTICEVDIFQYANTAVFKTLLSKAAEDNNGSGGTGVAAGLWRSLAAINSITIVNGGTFSAGTTIELVGI